MTVDARAGDRTVKRLSTGQRAALVLLVKRRCYTTTATYGDMNISGRAAQSLVRMGLVRYVCGWPATGNRCSNLVIVEITAAGKARMDGVS